MPCAVPIHLCKGTNGQGAFVELQHSFNFCQNISLHIHEEVRMHTHTHSHRLERALEASTSSLTLVHCRCCSGSKDEEDFRPLFDNFVQDLLVTLHLPEWPATELLLMLMGGLLVSGRGWGSVLLHSISTWLYHGLCVWCVKYCRCDLLFNLLLFGIFMFAVDTNFHEQVK